MNDPFANPRPWWEDDYVWRPQGAGDTAEDAPAPEPPSAPEPLPELIECWRCGKMVEEETATCPFCRAALRTRRPRARARLRALPLDEPDGLAEDLRIRPALGPMLWFFGGLLIVSLVFGLVLRGLAESGKLTEETVERFTLVAEGIDTVLVLLAIGCLPRPRSLPTISTEGRALAWLSSVPLLALLLGVNFLYHQALLRAIGVDRDFGARLQP